MQVETVKGKANVLILVGGTYSKELILELPLMTKTSAVSGARLRVDLRSICFPTRLALPCGTKNRELSTTALKKQKYALYAD